MGVVVFWFVILCFYDCFPDLIVSCGMVWFSFVWFVFDVVAGVWVWGVWKHTGWWVLFSSSLVF